MLSDSFFRRYWVIGYPSVENALNAHFGLAMLLILLALKLFMTSITIASGGSGGVFAPGLFMGAMLGGIDIIRKRAADRLASFLVEEAIHPEKLCLDERMTLEEAY